MFSTLFRIIKFSSQDFWRNFWLTTATIVVLVLALVSINFLITLNFLTKTAVAQVEDKIDVSVYFKPGVAESEIGNIKSYLLSLSEVKDVIYVSPEEALREFKKKHENDAVIKESLEEVGENPLGATLIVKAHDTANYPEILKVFDDAQYANVIQEKNFEDHKAIIKKIDSISEKAKNTGFGMAGLFAVVAILIGFNTVRMTIYTHREEIGVMKLVGAANWFVRAPYVASGIFYGIFAVFFTILLTFPAIGFAEPYFAGFFGGAEFNLLGYFSQNFLQIFGWQFAGVVLLNIVTSSLAVGRYLKV